MRKFVKRLPLLARGVSMPQRRPDVSEIGYWSEIKLDIIKEYASALEERAPR
jgi:hypothetical protein